MSHPVILRVGRGRDAALYAGGLMFQQATAFAVGIGTARWLGPGQLGEVSVARAVYGVAVILAPLGLDLSLLRHLGESAAPPAQKWRDVQALRRIAALVNVAAAAGGAALAGPWLQAHLYRQPRFALELALALAALPFAADLAILTAACRALERVALSSLASLYLQPVVRTAALTALLALGLRAPGVLAATTVGVAACDLVLWRAMARRFARSGAEPVSGGGAERPAARLLGYSGWMAAMLLTYGGLRLMDVLVLARARPAAEVGDYAAFSAIAQLITLAPVALSQTLGPRVAALHAAGDLAGARAELRAYLAAASRLCAPLFAGLAVFGPWLDLLFGARFRFAPLLCLALAAGAYVSAVFGPMSVSLSMTGRHRSEFAILLAGGCAALLAAVGLAPAYGGVGVACAMLGGYVAVNLARTAASARVMQGLDVGVSDLAPPAACLALALAVQGAAERLGRHDWPTALWAAGALAAACALLYGLWLWPQPAVRLGAEVGRRLSRRRTRSGAGAAPCRS